MTSPPRWPLEMPIYGLQCPLIIPGAVSISDVLPIERQLHLDPKTPLAGRERFFEKDGEVPPSIGEKRSIRITVHRGADLLGEHRIASSCPPVLGICHDQHHGRKLRKPQGLQCPRQTGPCKRDGPLAVISKVTTDSIHDSPPETDATLYKGRSFVNMRIYRYNTYI